MARKGRVSGSVVTKEPVAWTRLRVEMGNSSSSKTQDETVDFGFLTPHGVYTGPRDWNQQIAGQFIVERRLAPFYRPLEDYSDDWDDEQILAARRFPEGEQRHDNAGSDHRASSCGRDTPPSLKPTKSRLGKEPVVRLTEASLYRGAVECPICFMYYPPNINRSRCCFQPLCTECFVQIKRAEPTPTHLVSGPACCPYCQQEEFGVTYTPPPWRTGIGTETPASAPRPNLSNGSSGASSNYGNGRRKSLGADSPEVVTTDQIRPDWEEKLATVKATVARRANRRIIMRQVGDRLIPVGVTSSRTQLPEGITTVEDIEELMLMEAMRLSLLDQQQQQQRNGNRASSSNLNPISQPSVLSQRPSTPSQPIEGIPASSDPLFSGTPERMPRRVPSGAIAGPLASSANVIAVSVGLSSSGTPPQPSLPIVPTHVSRASTSSSNGSSAFATLRGRLTFGKNNDASRSREGDEEASTSGTGRHRRAESNPPPGTSVNGPLGAHGTATAFLQAPNASSGQQARSAPVSPRTSYVGLSQKNEGVPSPVLEIPTESAKAQVPALATEARETCASSSTTPAAAAPPPAPIPVPEPVEHPPATSN